jgi:hypothetical protein
VEVKKMMPKKMLVVVERGTKIVLKLKLLTFLSFWLSIIPLSQVFAQGNITGTVNNSDMSFPADSELTFWGFLDDTDEEIRTELSDGAGCQNGYWWDDFQNYLTEAPGNPYDYLFSNLVNGEFYHLEGLIPNNSYQEENIVLSSASNPSKPTGVKATVTSPSRVVVSWNKVAGITYHVYRRYTSINGSFFRLDDPSGSLANPGVSNSFFVDTTGDGVSSFTYMVIGEDASGNYTPHSDEATVNSSMPTAPVVSGISPNRGPTVGGTFVTIKGENFDGGGVIVTIRAKTATNVVVISPFELTCLTPAGSVGSADVIVTNIASGLASSPLVGGFTYYVNTPPVADAGLDQLGIIAGTLVTLDGSDSYDPDGDSLGYHWSQTSGPNVILSDSNISNPTFTPDTGGTYYFQLYVDDAIEYSQPDTVMITVKNQSPLLDSIRSQVMNEGQVLEFRVSATDPDGDTIILSVENIPTNATFVDSGDGAGSFTFNPDYAQSGVYDVTFIASDGSLADSEVVQITVNDVNRIPVADAGADRPRIEANTLVTLDGSESDDPDGDSITFHWTQVGGPTVVLSDSTAVQPTFTPTIKGDYIFQLIVNDGSLNSQPDSVTISVNNQAPIADAGPDQLGVKVNTLVTLNGSGSYDPDGDFMSYEWIQISGPFVSLSDSTVVNPTFTPVFTGEYLFQLIVSDGFLFSQPDTVLINVPALPQSISDLMATISGDSVLLTWSAVTTDTSGEEISIHGYVIYRGTEAYFDPTPSDSIGYTDSNTLSFVDPGIGGVNVVGDVDTNYYYVVKAVDIYGNYSDISNRVGEYDYEIVVTPTTDFSYVTLPFTGTGITDADDLISSIGASNINNVSRFIQSSQSYEARFAAGYGSNFPVVPGGIYQVNAKSYTIWSIAGAIPHADSINYSIITAPTTDFSFISIPFEDEDIYHTAQDVIDSLPGALNTLNNFIPSSQSWQSRFAAGYGPNFAVKPGGVYQANAKASATFPPGE